MRVMIATPCYASGVQSNYAASMFRLGAECAVYGLFVDYRLHAESLITRGRNRLLAHFLDDPSLTHFFFIDADVGFEPKAVGRLLLSDRDVACGVYPLKRNDWPQHGLREGVTEADFKTLSTPYPINPLPHGRLTVDKDGFAEVAEAPTGFMCIKRQVFEKMMLAYPDLKFSPEADDGGMAKTGPGSNWLFFDTLHDRETGRYLSEDYAFCRRWRDIGGKVYIDAHSKLSHQGQHIWEGDLKAHLDAKYIPVLGRAE